MPSTYIALWRSFKMSHCYGVNRLVRLVDKMNVHGMNMIERFRTNLKSPGKTPERNNTGEVFVTLLLTLIFNQHHLKLFETKAMIWKITYGIKQFCFRNVDNLSQIKNNSVIS